MQKTPLNQAHRDLGARMVEFGGWDMPVQYTGVIDEHRAVRRSAGLFDVSHMGEIEVRGRAALEFVQYLTTNDATRLGDGQVQYTALCYPDGGVVDDVTLYRSSATHFMFCVNAANISKDFDWMQEVLADSGLDGLELTNASERYAQLALQGPQAEAILSDLTEVALRDLVYYHFQHGEVAGVPTLISRTGYTGEDGFELYLPPDAAPAVWAELLDTGASRGLVPAGLGARDTLRLEKGFALYGHEISAEISPLEAGLGWITKFDADDFVGRRALLTQKEQGIPRRRVGLLMQERGIPRQDYSVEVEGRWVGTVTSGTLSPTLQVGIALALVETGHHAVETELDIVIRNRRCRAQVVRLPFVR